jgi:hypothetical protein
LTSINKPSNYGIKSRRDQAMPELPAISRPGCLRPEMERFSGLPATSPEARTGRRAAA